MTTFTIPRGEFFQALKATLPHAGRQTEIQPWAGRIRLTGQPDALNIYATDNVTAALAAITDPIYVDGELPAFDLEVNAVKIILSFFRPPSDKVVRAAWLLRLLKIFVTDGVVTLTEIENVTDSGIEVIGEQISLPITDIEYPDVPKLLANFARQQLDPVLTREQGQLTLSVDYSDEEETTGPAPRILVTGAIARFGADFSAYGERFEFISQFAHGREAFDVRVGYRFIGRVVVPAIDAQDIDEFDQCVDWWRTILPAPITDLTSNDDDEVAAVGGGAVA